MKSSIFNAVGDFFALDIGTSALRVVQLKAGKSLVRYGSLPIDSKITMSDAPADQVKVGEAVKQLVTQVGVTTSNVVLGLPSNKTFVTIVDIPRVSPQELTATLRYQADQYIPMSLDEAKLDWAVLGDSPVDKDKIEVLLASVSNKYSESRMEMLENIGLNVVALEPDSIAIARSLTPESGGQSELIIDMGEISSDIIITLAGAPRLVRSIPVGGESLIKAAVQNLNIDENQARQFVYKFGLDNSKLEGQIYRSLESTVEVISSEVQKSIKFYATRYQSTPLQAIVTSGVAAVLPGFHQYLSAAANGIVVQAGNSWQNINYANNLHEDLMKLNYQYAVAAGLAERQGA